MVGPLHTPITGNTQYKQTTFYILIGKSGDCFLDMVPNSGHLTAQFGGITPNLTSLFTVKVLPLEIVIGFLREEGPICAWIIEDLFRRWLLHVCLVHIKSPSLLWQICVVDVIRTPYRPNRPATSSKSGVSA